MELISVGFVQNTVHIKCGKQRDLKLQVDDYFGRFVDIHDTFEYLWVDEKLYVGAEHGEVIKKDIEDALNVRIAQIEPKVFPEDYEIAVIDIATVKRNIERKKNRRKYEQERKKFNTKKRFLDTYKNIVSNTEGFKYVGCFDLEFWEQDMNIILEFGWRIDDVHGNGKTTHLIIKENIHYENKFYTTNNKFSREDSEIVTLEVAKKRFQTEFLDKADVFVGHGLSNDIKVLKNNGVPFKKKYSDTTDIGAILLGRISQIGLEKLLSALNIKNANLHNAAYDAEFILKAFWRLGKLYGNVRQ